MVAVVTAAPAPDPARTPSRSEVNGMPELLRMAPVDRRCRPWSLDNPLRRRFAPAARELELLDLRPGFSVADLGTGVGFFLPGLLQRLGPGGRIYAVDPDSRNLEAARTRARGDPRATFLVGSAARVPEIPDASIDRVVLSLVLCCMADKEGALDESWRILRPGGRAYASWPRLPKPFRPRRAVSLRVTPERWNSLVHAHPWRELPVRSSWTTARRMLKRPAVPESG
jgi:SAM-dependent methyltransferase